MSYTGGAGQKVHRPSAGEGNLGASLTGGGGRGIRVLRGVHKQSLHGTQDGKGGRVWQEVHSELESKLTDC